MCGMQDNDKQVPRSALVDLYYLMKSLRETLITTSLRQIKKQLRQRETLVPHKKQN